MNYKITKSFEKQELESFLSSVFQLDGEDVDQELSEWFSIDGLDRYLENGFCIEAREKEKLIGFSFCGKQNLITWPDGKKMEIFVIAVDKMYQSKGIGREIISLCGDEAKKFGAKSLLLNCHESLDRLRKFYINVGFTEIGILKSYYDNGNAVFFSKEVK